MVHQILSHLLQKLPPTIFLLTYMLNNIQILLFVVTGLPTVCTKEVLFQFHISHWCIGHLLTPILSELSPQQIWKEYFPEFLRIIEIPPVKQFMHLCSQTGESGLVYTVILQRNIMASLRSSYVRCISEPQVSS